ncbi:uncharacterized protein BT62DRAFT_893711, partial [Guyanagaster necrorhizus]
MVARSSSFVLVATIACRLASVGAAPTGFGFLSVRADSNSTSNSSSSSSFTTSNGLEAQQLNAQFASLSANDSCTTGDQACVNGGFAQCVSSAWEVTECASGTSCFALPLVNSAGTSLSCDSESDALARIEATGVTGG